MTIVETRESRDALPGEIDVVFKEARRRARRRRGVAMALVLSAVLAALELGSFGGRGAPGQRASSPHERATKVLAATTRARGVVSPYPAVLSMTPGLLFSKDDTFVRRGSVLTASESRSVTASSPATRVRWGVWRDVTTQYPVRSLDAGSTWVVSGPGLASDWAGGSLYYVSRVITESATAVVMVSNSIIDVSTDDGLRWYQYLNASDNWNMSEHNSAEGVIGLRVGPDQWALNAFPKGSYALYRLDVAQHRWRRVSQHVA
jgi:hypothetical protein